MPKTQKNPTLERSRLPQSTRIFSKIAFLMKNDRQNGPWLRWWTPPRRPKAAPKRSKNASATQPRFFIDLGSILAPILAIISWFWHVFSLLFYASVTDVCRFLAFKHLASSHQYPWGAAVSLCVYNGFWEPFWHRFFMIFRASILHRFFMTFYRFSVSLNLVKIDFRWGRVAKIKVLQASNFNRF